AIVVESRGGRAEGHDFGVGCGVHIAQHAVLAARENFAFVNHDDTDRDFAGFSGQASFGERGFHGLAIVGHGLDAIAAGCCCVMQCSAPRPQMRSTEWTPMTSRSGKTSASVFKATRSL